MPFCEKEEQCSLRKIFCKKIGTSETCSDVVGVAGFEPVASASRTRRSTKLSHTPINHKKYYTIKGYGLSRIIL